MQTCSTRAAAFAAHGIEDGSVLIERTYYALAADGHREPAATAEFAECVATAFRGAFVRSAAVPLVPEPVEEAIGAATDGLVHRVLDDPDADLRTELLPAFYRSVAGTFCAHLEAGGDPGAVGAWYEDDDDGGVPVEP